MNTIGKKEIVSRRSQSGGVVKKIVSSLPTETSFLIWVVQSKRGLVRHHAEEIISTYGKNRLLSLQRPKYNLQCLTWLFTNCVFRI